MAVRTVGANRSAVGTGSPARNVGPRQGAHTGNSDSPGRTADRSTGAAGRSAAALAGNHIAGIGAPAIGARLRDSRRHSPAPTSFHSGPANRPPPGAVDTVQGSG